MKILSRIGELKFARFWQLAAVGLQHPLLVWPTYKATERTVQICDRLFGNSHNGNNKANAFRHALWVILISRNAFEISKNMQKALQWSEKITALHEKLMPNKPLETAMDLHNDKMGLKYFTELTTASEGQIIDFLKLKMEGAKIISDVKDVQDFDSELVYIDE